MKDKELLLKDLCGRLPYSVKASFYGVEEECECWDVIEIITYNGFVDIGQYELPIEAVKPYLFPLSSMTREQKNQLLKISGIGSCIIRKDNITFCSNIDLCALGAIFDFLDRNHFDYRGLIGKGLAIDATELNIY